jgi:hypothetical protein
VLFPLRHLPKSHIALLSSKCALQSIGKENTGVRIRIAVVQGP